MMKLSTLIVDKRKGFYLIFILLILYSVFSMNKVKVNNDLTSYLPDTTETRQGLDLMEEQFVTYGTARVMVCNVTFQEAEVLAEDKRAVVDLLLRKKQQVTESWKGERFSELDAYIISNFEEYKAKLSYMHNDKKQSWDILNQVFADCLFLFSSPVNSR